MKPDQDEVLHDLLYDVIGQSRRTGRPMGHDQAVVVNTAHAIRRLVRPPSRVTCPWCGVETTVRVDWFSFSGVASPSVHADPHPCSKAFGADALYNDEVGS